MTVDGVMALIAGFLGIFAANYRQALSLKKSINAHLNESIQTHVAKPISDSNEANALIFETMKNQSKLIENYDHALAQVREDAIRTQEQSIIAHSKLLETVAALQETQQLANQLRIDKEQYLREIKALTDNQNLLRGNVNDLELKLEAVERVQEERTRKIKELEAAMSVLTKELDTTRDAAATATEELNKTRAALVAATQRIQDIERERRAERIQLETELKAERAKVTALQQKVFEQEKEIVRLTGDVKRLQSQLEEANRVAAEKSAAAENVVKTEEPKEL